MTALSRLLQSSFVHRSSARILCPSHLCCLISSISSLIGNHGFLHPTLILSHYDFCTLKDSDQSRKIIAHGSDEIPLNLSPFPHLRSRTPLEKEFETWIYRLKPGFCHADVEYALRSQSDPDLALDIFRWTAQQKNFRHNATTYKTIIEIAISGRRYGQVETLMEEVVAGACEGTQPLFNLMINFCCTHRRLFSRAFDIFKKMQKLPSCKPSLQTYTLLLHCLLRRFSRLNVSHIYLHAVRSLVKQMKASGVIPDLFTLNLIIKAYSQCLQMEEALRVFREMGLYGCEPNNYTYSYIAKGLCGKGRVAQGFSFYKEMRQKGFVPTSSTYMILICSLSMQCDFEGAVAVLHDMLDNRMAPDSLSYRTLLEGLCKEGRHDDAFGLLEKLLKEKSLDEKTYSNLLCSLNRPSRAM